MKMSMLVFWVVLRRWRCRCWTSGLSHGGEDVDVGLLGCNNASWTCSWIPAFRWEKYTVPIFSPETMFYCSTIVRSSVCLLSTLFKIYINAVFNNLLIPRTLIHLFPYPSYMPSQSQVPSWHSSGRVSRLTWLT
jgi:hypothetical protein